MAYIFEYIRSIVGKDYFIQKLHDNEAGIFYDLGSGTGKAVIAMALCCPFKKLVGFELLKGLWDLSMRSRFAYYKHISDKFMKFNDIFSIERTNEIDFYKNARINESDYSELISNQIFAILRTGSLRNHIDLPFYFDTPYFSLNLANSLSFF